MPQARGGNSSPKGGGKRPEREGFEPSVQSPTHLISNLALSATQTSLRVSDQTGGMPLPDPLNLGYPPLLPRPLPPPSPPLEGGGEGG